MLLEDTVLTDYFVLFLFSHLRPDIVAHILTLANIHAHSNVIVMETCQGLLVGALLERMGGLPLKVCIDIRICQRGSIFVLVSILQRDTTDISWHESNHNLINRTDV